MIAVLLFVATFDVAAALATSAVAAAETVPPAIADARIQQSNRAPVFAVDVDRSRAQELGMTARDVTNSLVVNLAGSSQVAPTYWLNPANGISYPIVMQAPQHQLDSLSALAKHIAGTSWNGLLFYKLIPYAPRAGRAA